MPHFTRAKISNINEISNKRHLAPESDKENNDLTGAAEGEQRISAILKALINLKSKLAAKNLGCDCFPVEDSSFMHVSW